MSAHQPVGDSNPRKLSIGMLLYPGFTLLDLAGPQAALGLHGKTSLFWKTLDPVFTDTGLSMNPTTTFDGAPDKLDVLFVPGGFGINDAMKDSELVAFLAKTGSSARYITSVCTGSLLLAMAGLLDGYKAATHWAFYDALEALGVEARHDRVVADGNRFTGGGVTAGIDFGISLLCELRGEETAKIIQLAMEYDPKPQFNVGHPREAGPELTARAVDLLGADLIREAVDIAKANRLA